MSTAWAEHMGGSRWMAVWLDANGERHEKSGLYGEGGAQEYAERRAAECRQRPYQVGDRVRVHEDGYVVEGVVTSVDGRRILGTVERIVRQPAPPTTFSVYVEPERYAGDARPDLRDITLLD